MGIIRTNKRDNLAFFDRSVLDDPRLTWKAKGVAAYLLSHGNGWEIRTKELINRSKDQRDSVLAALRELEDTGYLKRERRQNKDGTFDWNHELSETSSTYPCPDFPDTDKPDTENPVIYKSTSYLESSSDGVDGYAIKKMCEQDGMMYFERDFVSLVNNAIGTFGVNAVLDAREKTAKAHKAKLSSGGITSPMHYMAVVLSSTAPVRTPVKEPVEVMPAWMT